MKQLNFLSRKKIYFVKIQDFVFLTSVKKSLKSPLRDSFCQICMYRMYLKVKNSLLRCYAYGMFFLPVVFEHGKHGRIGGIRTKINETKGFLDLNFITSLVDVGVIFDMPKSMHDSHGQSEG